MIGQSTPDRDGAELERLAESNFMRRNGLRQLVGRWIGRVAENLPSGRARLFVLVQTDPAPLLAAPERLQATLTDFDLPAAGSAFADLGGVAMPSVAEDLARLRSDVDSYEYDEARVLATRLLEQIGGEIS